MVVAVAETAVDDGDGVDVEDGCVDGVVGTAAAVAAATAAGVVDFDAFRASTIVVAVVVDLDSSCSPGMLVLGVWFERDTKAFC